MRLGAPIPYTKISMLGVDNADKMLQNVISALVGHN